MRLTALLREYPPAATPETEALAALMALDAARLPARLDAAGDLNPLAHHDRTMWDAALIGEGLALLERSARGGVVSRYHVEAAIAAAHASAPDLDATDWPLIVSLYDRLLAIAPTPVVALSRALAIAERDGAAAGLAAIARDRRKRAPRALPVLPGGARRDASPTWRVSTPPAGISLLRARSPATRPSAGSSTSD